MTRTLFLAWEDPVEGRWYPIGRLTSDDRRYVFVYTGGVLDAQRTGRFRLLPAFPEFRRVYQSDALFPLFANRLLPASRPDFDNYLQWLNLGEADPAPLAILARTGGQRVTDNLEVFTSPERISGSMYETSFFLHGLNYLPKESSERVDRLERGEQLLLMWDFQNPNDPSALAVRTAEKFPGYVHVIGYCPRHLRGEIQRLLTTNGPVLTVERINPPPAPLQYRALCRLRVRLPDSFAPFSEPEYQPILALDEKEILARAV